MTRDGHGDPRPVPAGTFKRTCQGCGQPFRADEPRQRYCTLHCKRSVQNRRAYQRQKAKH